MYFWYYKLSKTWLDNSLKSVVSEHPLTVNKLKGPKYLWNLHETTFIIFQHVKMSQILVKSALQRFYHILSSLWREMFGKYLPERNIKS